MKIPQFNTWSESEDRDPEDIDKPIRSGKIKIKRKGVGMISFDEYEDHVDMYCPHCEKYSDVKNKLGPRILEKDKPIPIDNNKFVQCYKCGNIYGVHEIEKQKNLVVSELKGHVVESPFEANQTLTESIPKRTSKAGQRALSKRRKERDRQHHKDKDIDIEIQQHGIDNVNVIYDSDP